MPTNFEHPTSEFAARQFLEELGCVPLPVAILTRRLQPLLFLVLSGLALLAALLAGPELERHKLQLDVGNLVLAVGLILAVSQWHASLEHQAMEKYEAEIAASNAAADTSPDIHVLMAEHYPQLPHETTPNYARARYVYQQLDNLEYALERYVQGLASAYTTARAVMTFENRCRVSAEFCERARRQVAIASYSPVVLEVAGRVLA